MKGFAVFLTGITLHFIAWGMLEPLVPLYVLKLGGSPAMVGVVTSASSLMPVIAAVWIGAVSSRMGTKRSLFIGGVGTVISFGAFALSGNIGVLILSQALFGLFHLWRIIPAQAWISYSSGTQLYHNFGYYAFAVTMGQLIGPPVGGWIVEHAGSWLPMEHSDYASAFLVGGFIMLASIVVHAFLPPDSAEQRPKAGGDGFKQVVEVARQRDVQILTMVSMLIWMGIALRRSYFPVYLQDHGLSPSRVGLVLATYSAVSLMLRPLLGLLVERVGQRRLLYTSFGLAAVVLLGIPLASTLTPLLSLAAFWGFSHGIGLPVVMAMSTEVVEPAKRGLAVGLRVAANRVGEGIGPLIFSLFTTLMSVSWAFVAASVLMGGGLALTAILPKVRPQGGSEVRQAT